VIPVDSLNSHYASVACVKDAELMKSCATDYETKNRFTPGDSDTFHFKYVLPEDIIGAINSIKSKAMGIDQIPIDFIKLCLPALLPVLDHLFNYSLQNSIFPSIWKLANIISVPKIKVPKESKDYRPVSILCILRKVLEKIVHKQVVEYLNEHSILPQNQSGFRKCHSTETALLKATDDIREAIDKKMMSLLVLLDFSKAFDCDVLLANLRYIGFSGAAIYWFKSYLHKRQHRVFVSEQKASAWTEIETGVPQGSVLGPLLFLVYMFDLPDVIKHSCYHMYADDIQLYTHFSVNSFKNSLAVLTQDLYNVIDFCSQHNLDLNVSKTQAIIIGTQRYLTTFYELEAPKLIINNCIIPYSTTVCNLGVVFDPTLSWYNHCLNIVHKVLGTLAQLRRSFAYIPTAVRKLLVKSLIMPHFKYASALFTYQSLTMLSCNAYKTHV